MRSIRKLRQRVKKNPTDIPYDVKISVAIRDNGVCVNCKNKRGIGQLMHILLQDNLVDLVSKKIF